MLFKYADEDVIFNLSRSLLPYSNAYDKMLNIVNIDKYHKYDHEKLIEKLKPYNVTSKEITLLQGMLCPNPNVRLTTNEILKIIDRK